MKKTLLISFIALFAAVICIGCFLRIPVGAVPIVLQNALCILTAIILGGVLGGAPTALFLLAGLVGLPVYSGGSSGLAVWAGPTGGFLPGYLLGAVVAALIAGRPSVEQKKVSFSIVLRISIAMFVGMALMYIPGIWHFMKWAVSGGKVAEGTSAFRYALGACMLPYIPGDLLKTVVGILVALKVRPVLAQYLGYSSKSSKKDSAEAK